MTAGRRGGLDARRNEYLEWLLLDARTRRAHGLPEDRVQFADLKGISDRTLRRWQNDPEFQLALEQRREQIAGRISATGAVTARPHPNTDARVKRRLAPPAPPTNEHDRIVDEAHEAGVDGEEADYLSVKAAIRDAAAGGDSRALEQYMRYWGQPYAELERERRESSYADLSDGELIGRVRDLANALEAADVD